MLEQTVQRAVKRAMENDGWHIIKMHGSAYQRGIPDLYCMHKQYGTRWVELKSPTRSGQLFTPAQYSVFRKFVQCKIGIWMLTSVSDIQKLFRPSNLLDFMKFKESTRTPVAHILREGYLRDKAGTLPEDMIQERLTKKFQGNGWTVLRIHGNRFQKGLPDLYCMHPVFGARWVEVKLPDMIGSRFTTAQSTVFPTMLAHNVGIWILTDYSEQEYNKIFKKSNALHYLISKA